jgi:hypothetical protein
VTGSATVRAQDPAATEASASSASATQAAEAPDVERARALFSEGLAFVGADDWVHAEQRFRSVLALKASLVVSYNLASALVHLDRLIEASELLRSMLRDRTLDAKTYAATQQLLSEVEPRIAGLTLRLLGDVSGVTVRVDNRQVDVSGEVLMVSVDPGEHTLVVARHDATIRTEVLTFGGTSPLRTEITIELPSALAPGAVAHAAHTDASRMPAGHARRAPESTRTASDASTPKWWLWAGAGGLLAVAVVVVVVVASSGGQADPVSGDTDPPVVGGIVMEMP